MDKFNTHQAHLAGAAQEDKVVLLNAPVLTVDGSYTLTTVDLETVRQLVHTRGFASAIGHIASAQIISTVLGIECPANRCTLVQRPGQTALVFRLRERLAEGRVLRTVEEVEAIGFNFGLLFRHV